LQAEEVDLPFPVTLVGLELSFWARPETAARSAKKAKKAMYFVFTVLSLGTESYTIARQFEFEI